jgi:predicted permease
MQATTPAKLPRLLERLYAALLRVYPAEFRRQFGREMVEAFRDSCVDVHTRWGHWPLVAHGMHAIGELLLEGVRERSVRWKRAVQRSWPVGRPRNVAMQSGSRYRGESMRWVFNDIRFALRGFRKNPTFVATVVVVLALGIGANTTIFSVVDSLLLRPLPYPEPGQLITINHVYPSLDLVAGVSVPGFRDYRDRTRSFETVAISQGWSANLTGTGVPVRLFGGRVGVGYFEAFGIAPIMGRSFLPEEDAPGNEQVVVIGNGFWQQRLGGAPDVIGSSIRLNDESYQVVGVMPPGFEDFFNGNREFWVPLALPSEAFDDRYRSRENHRLVARLKSGVTVNMAASEMSALAETIKEEFPDAYSPTWTLRVISLDERRKGNYRATLWVLFGAVGFVLLITCANVANLLLARGLGRQKEVAIRKALGADRRRLIGQLLTESVVLSTAGGIAGLLLAGWGIRGLVMIGPEVLTRTEIGVDAPVLAFTLLVSLGVGVLFGLAPAIQGTGTDLQQTLREGGQASQADKGAHGVRRILIMGEFALALILLTGSGLMIQSIAHLRGVDPGFQPDHLLTASIRIPATKYPDQPSQNAFFDRLRSELEAVAGIKAAGTTTVLPFGGSWSTSIFNIEGYEPGENEPPPWGDIRVVSPGFADALGVPVLRGRFIDETDGPDSPPVVVVDDEFVRRYWPDDNPIGKRITFDDPQNEDPLWLSVIGVVRHTMHEGLDAEARIQLYFSSRQYGGTGAQLVVRTETEPAAMAASVRRAVFSIDGDQPISNVRIMEDLITESIGNRRLLMQLLTLFSGLAIVLASLGIYGIMSHMVRERARELGLRMALGATGPTLFGLVLKRGLVLAGIGLAIGIAGALGLTRLLQSQLYEVAASDPFTLAAVGGILLGVALLAICVPANRAARVDPIENLRAE